MAAFNKSSNAELETLNFRYKTIAGIIQLPVPVRPLQDEAHGIAKQFAVVNHIHGDDIVNTLTEELAKFITQSLRRRLNRAQAEIQMMQTVYSGDQSGSSSFNPLSTNQYQYDKLQKLEEENRQFRTVIDASGDDLKRYLKTLTDQTNEQRIKADKATAKLARLQEKLDSEEDIEHVFQRLVALKSTLEQEKHVANSLRLKLEETQEQADAYRLEVQKLKEQMGVALDSVSDSRLSSKVGRLQDEIQLLRSKLSEERRKGIRLESNAKSTHGITHMAVAEWAIERRRAQFANNNRNYNSITRRNAYGQKLLSNGGDDDNITTSGDNTNDPSSINKVPSLARLKNMLRDAKWAVDSAHWKNVRKIEFLVGNDPSEIVKEPKLEDPIFLRKALRDMRFSRANSVWRDRLHKMPRNKLLQIAITASNDLSQMEEVVLQLEKDRDRYKVKFRQEELEHANVRDKYREMIFSDKLGNAAKKRNYNNNNNSVNGGDNIGSNGEGIDTNNDFQPLFNSTNGRAAWMTWAAEKFKMKKELNVAKEECLKQLNDERQRFELLTEEVAIELYKLLAIWEHERRERTQI